MLTKVKLSPEQETLLITLYAKAQPDNPLFYDPTARQILDQIDYDFSSLQVPYKTVVLVCQRAKKLDSYVREFLKEQPDSLVLQLGAGLDSRFWRVDDGRKGVDVIDAQVGDGEGAISDLGRTQLVRPGPFGQPNPLTGQIGQRFLVGVADDRHDQAVIQRHCQANVDVR